jgi:hypothetical protein
MLAFSRKSLGGAPMPESKTFTGGCHCGKVRYEATSDLSRVMQCNCSICSKKGTLISPVAKDQFRLLSGESELADYQFNKHVIHHLFCRTCGVQSFSRGKTQDGREMFAINVRCLDGVDPAALTITPFNGRAL